MFYFCRKKTSKYSSKIQQNCKKKTKRVMCKLHHTDVLSRALKSYGLRDSFKKIFKELLVKGVKKRKIHYINWMRMGKVIYNTYFELHRFCPLFKK